ncbi:C-GCAxxG-C-C family protein [Eubacterium oxidoreducens]|uniref:C_GCAxxG_C_C family probable redox protein n=1 Tax=Eubacterium oxidoreducens TaxID=1732 RepID=A0A1G6A607_EUBOX|nr:C-GCAxxG-C-C family protein [Eubacterium oxidoreducens]SDB03854.1 C_GCAxxG_C_C family probable redox protein [Eubacterium oxidoreducens]
MSDYLDYTRKLRGEKADRHYNCAQATVLPFAKEKGLDIDAVIALCENYGAGMKRGGICGAIAGGLMALGLNEITDGKSIKKYYDAFLENHQGYLDCKDLLRLNKEAGGDKKAHCDGMIEEAVLLVEQIITEKKDSER